MSKMSRDQYIEKRVAEGFTKEQAIHEYDRVTDPAIAKAQEQTVPTRGDVLGMIHEATMANPDKSRNYTPNFKLTKEYADVQKQIKEAQSVGDLKKVQELNRLGMSVALHGTFTDEMRQEEIDKTLEMPIADILKEKKKQEKSYRQYEEKIDNFDVSSVQAKVDALVDEYKKKHKANRGNWVAQATIESECNKAVEDLEFEEVTKPLNDLKVKRYVAKEIYLIYEARVRFYVNANRALIEEEIENAKRAEVRGSLVDLAEYVEE